MLFFSCYRSEVHLTQEYQDFQRQKDPNGLLKMVLDSNRISLTSANPGQFYNRHRRSELYPWRELKRISDNRRSLKIDFDNLQSLEF